MSKYKIGDHVWLRDVMNLNGRIISARPTLLGKQYEIKVLWDDDTYTNYTRMWWRIWL